MKIKQLAEDFVVEEIIDIELCEGDLLYFWLNKREWTTEAAIRNIAKKLGVSYRRFKFAGSKDKMAVTKQAVSVFKVDKERLEDLDLKDIKIEIIGKGDKPLSIGTLKGNKFDIVVRDLDENEIFNLKKNSDIVKKEGFPNFFGPQRFGKGNTHLIGKAILKGNLQDAVKGIICFVGDRESGEKKEFRGFAKDNWGSWSRILDRLPRYLNLERDLLKYLKENENDYAGALRRLPKHIRKLYVHAYQSWIWNKSLEKNLDSRGKLFLPGYKSRLGNDNFSKSIKSLLEEDGVDLDVFLCKRMPEIALEGDFRDAFVKIDNFELGKIENDELGKNKKLKVSFELPKGSYATVLIDYLFN